MTHQPDLISLIKKSTAHLETLMEQLNGSLFVFSTNYELEYSNDSFINKFDTCKNNKNIFEIINKPDNVYPIERIKLSIDSKLLFSEEVENHHRNIKEQITIIPIILKDNLYYFAGMITETANETSSKEDIGNLIKFETISDLVLDAMIIINSENKITYWNKASEKIFGYTKKEMLGETLHEIIAPKRYRIDALKGLKHFKHTGEGFAIGKTLELEAIKKDGTEFVIELSVSSIKLNKEWHAVGIVRDITERKNIEKELATHHEQLHINHKILQEKEEELVAQNEELQTKEEELIAQNEELQTKEEELIAQNEELIGINAEMDYSKSLLENSLEQTLISEEKFRKLFTSMYDGIIIYESIFNDNNEFLDYIIIDLNPAAETLLGVTKNELIGQGLLTTFGFEKQTTYTKINNALNASIPEYFELYLEKFQKYFRIGVSIIEANRFTIIFNDISKRKQLEETLINERTNLEIIIQERTKDLKKSNKNLKKTQKELKKAFRKVETSEKRYRHLFTTMNEGLIICELIYDKDGNPIDYILLEGNPAYEKIIGLKLKDSVNITATKNLQTDEAPHIANFHRVIQTGQPETFVAYLGSLGKYLQTSAFQIEGNMFAALFTDITGPITTKNKLAESEQKFHAISDSAIDPIIMIDSQGKTLYWNKAAEKVFGYTSEEIIGEQLHDFIVPLKYKNAINNGLNSFKETGVGPVIGTTIKVNAITKNKTEITLEISISSIKLQDEWHAIAIARDITQKNKLETDLRNNLREKFKLNKKLNQALKEADAANKTKSEFLAVISHEIRTPINGIVGIMNLLSDTEVTEEQKEYLKMMNLSTDTLLNIINNILDFSKLEVGKLILEQQDFNLDENICNLLKCFSFIAQEKNINLVYSISSNIPEVIRGDSSKLNQIIINLVNNAIKFTPEGEISITIKSLYQTKDNICLLFSVSDTGIGIPDDKKSIIFDSFTQVDNSTTRKYGGTGLGLAIASELIELMNGEIWLESQLNKGSTFNFTAIFEVTNMQIDVIDFKELPILVLSDNKTNEHFYNETLKKWNCKVISINNIDKIDTIMEKSLQDKTKFGSIILDSSQTEKELVDFINCLYTTYQITVEKLIIITTSQIYHSIKNNKIDIKNLLLKPIKQSELLETIQNVIMYKGSEHKHLLNQFEKKDDTSPNKLNILLAEDNEINKILTEKILTKRGHDVIVVSNGKEAVLEFEKNTFDIVLLDLEMPEMNGYETAEAILKNGNIPIIALTAHTSEKEKEKVLQAGMINFLSKPFKPEQLINYVEKHANGDVDKLELKLINKDTPLEYLQNDDELIKELVEIFKNAFPKTLIEIDKAIEESNRERLTSLSHSIKGSISNFTTTQAYKTACDLQKAADENDFSKAREIFKQLKTDLNNLNDALNKIIKF